MRVVPCENMKPLFTETLHHAENRAVHNGSARSVSRGSRRPELAEYGVYLVGSEAERAQSRFDRERSLGWVAFGDAAETAQHRADAGERPLASAGRTARDVRGHVQAAAPQPSFHLGEQAALADTLLAD